MIRTILGRRGYGKTTLATRFIRERDKPAIVVTFDEHLMREAAASHRFTSSRALLRHVVAKGGLDLNSPLVVSIFSPEEFHLLCRVCITHRRMLLVIDEIDLFDRANGFQEPEFQKIIHYGRHDVGGRIDLVTTSRRPARISRDLRSQTDEWFIFRTTDSRDLKFFEDDVVPDQGERIRALEKFRYLRWDGEDLGEGRVTR